MPVKLTDGFIYPSNVSFWIIPDMAFKRWKVFNSKSGLSKVNLVLTVVMKRRMCSSIENKVWLICENQVSVRGGVIFANMSKFIY